MKKRLAALLAALALLALTACRAEPAPAETTAAPETTTAVPETTTAAPETTAAASETTTAASPSGSSCPAVVTAEKKEGSVEESVGYNLRTPQASSCASSAAQTINDYYAAAEGKLADFASGELYEQAMNDRTVLNLTSDYTVERNGGGILSILRSAVVSGGGESDRTTWYAETFNLASGGLYTLDDFFTVPEADYKPLLLKYADPGDADDPKAFAAAAEASFDKKRFYVTADALVFFYQPGDLGPPSSFFEVPVALLGDAFQWP